LDVPNLREDLLTEMRRLGLACRCIRCREPGATSGHVLPKQTFVRRVYAASGGAEHFLSIESEDRRTMLGFVRLRLPPAQPAAPVPPPRPAPARAISDEGVDRTASSSQAGAGDEAINGIRRGTLGGAELVDSEQPFPELVGAALVREVHVYGQLISTADKTGADAQHTGIGRRLMSEAEATARAHGYWRVAVIAGIGSRGYYRKLGYELEPGEGQFMMKTLGRFAPGWVHACMPALEAVRAGALVLGMLLLLVMLSMSACHAEAGGRLRCALFIL
jgi:GNAT superfamily N-acetyltransferase